MLVPLSRVRGNLGLGSHCHGHEDKPRKTREKDIFGWTGVLPVAGSEPITVTGTPPARVGPRFLPINLKIKIKITSKK